MTLSNMLIAVGGVLIGWGFRDAYTQAYTWWVLREPDHLAPSPAADDWDDIRHVTIIKGQE